MPARVYLSIPTRPPAEHWVEPPDEQALARAFHILRGKVERVELLTGYEGNALACTGDVAADICSGTFTTRVFTGASLIRALFWCQL